MLTANVILNETYQIMRPIGKGGMGVVYLAYHLRLQKYVVVKRIAQNITGRLSARTEADILKNLHHPNLPQVYDFVQEGSSVYTVIDYIDGEDLGSYIRSGYIFSEQELVRWMRQLAQALEYLHSRTPPVLHMDIKPGNIMIDRQGNAVLIDFNISLNGAADTVAGLSAAYASPEQFDAARGAEGIVLDGRSDIYSLGACFYRLLSGHEPSPFGGNQFLTEMPLDYSEAFRGVIDRCMYYAPEARFRSAEKLLAALGRLRHQNRRYRALLLSQCAVILVGALLLAGGFFCLINGAQKEKYDEFRIALTQFYVSYSDGDAERMERQGQRLLTDEEYRGLLRERASEHQRLLRIMGDAAYDQGAYDAAQTYYEEGERAGSSQTECRACLRGRILAAAQNGEPDEAQRLLTEAVAAGMDENESLYLNAVLCAQRGEAEASAESASKLLAQCADPNFCTRACLAAASVAQDAQTQLTWLKTALQYGEQKAVWRGLVQVYSKLAEQNYDGASAQNALYYAKLLAEQNYPSKNDRISYATTLRLNGRDAEARRVLETLLSDYPNDCLTLIQLAFACDALGNKADAGSYCEQALAAWRADVSPDKLAEDSEEIQNLLALSERVH